MDLTKCLILRPLLLLFLLSPAILLQLSTKVHAKAAESKNVMGQQKDDTSGSEVYEANPHSQHQDGLWGILQKFHSYDQFMKRTSERLDEVYSFMQELKRERLGQERLRQEPSRQEPLKIKMIEFPRATLYTGTNFTGNSERYDLKLASDKNGCHQLKKYSGRIKSIDTEGTCVRIFSKCTCESWSQAFYPGIDGNAINSKLQGVMCIGPCSSNELEGAEIRGSSSQLTVIKPKKGVPDLIGDWWTGSSANQVTVPGYRDFQYSLGAGKNTMGAVFAYITSQRLRTPEVAEGVREAGRNYTNGRFQLDKYREEVGFRIPLELGGPSDREFNVFPQDKTGAVKYRQAFVPVIKKHFQENANSSYAVLAVSFFYENLTDVKPTGMWYRMHLNATNEVTYGYLFN